MEEVEEVEEVEEEQHIHYELKRECWRSVTDKRSTVNKALFRKSRGPD